MHGPEARRRELYSLLGDLPPRDRPVSARTLAREDLGYGRLERLELDLNGIEPVPALFLHPGTPGPWPVVLYNHSHGGRYHVGKDELLVGAPYVFGPWGEELVRAGYAVLAVDHWAFGRRGHHTESDTFKLMLWRGQVMWGMMVYDSLKAIDYLVGRPDVDASRVATVGMSMGSTMAWWVAALDERVRVCVDVCCLTDYQALIEVENLKGHGLFYFVPGLLKHFTAAQVNELIAPRPHLALAGELDPLTPVPGLDRIDAELRRAYAGVPERWRLSRYPVAHEETAEMRREAVAFLKRWL